MSRMGAYDEHNEVPIIVRGEGTRIYDANGTEYFDGLSGLFTNTLGHGRSDIGEAAGRADQRARLLPAVDLRPPQGHRTRREVWRA